MHLRSRTCVGNLISDMESFTFRIGLHHGSTLQLLHFCFDFEREFLCDLTFPLLHDLKRVEHNCENCNFRPITMVTVLIHGIPNVMQHILSCLVE